MNMRTDPRLDPNNDPACRDVDPEIFHPLPGHNDVAEIAKAVCHRCPVKAKCLAWAYESKEPHGILGGLTYKERKDARRREREERAARELAEHRRRHLLADLEREQAAGTEDLWKELASPVPIAAWSEPEWAQ